MSNNGGNTSSPPERGGPMKSSSAGARQTTGCEQRLANRRQKIKAENEQSIHPLKLYPFSRLSLHRCTALTRTSGISGSAHFQ